MHERQTARDDQPALVEVCLSLALRRHARSPASPDREDIEQDACVRALATENPNRISDPIRYLMRITRNLFIDSRRRKQRETAAMASIEALAVTATEPLNPERILAGKEDLQRALDAIESLPVRCREAFVLHRFHNLSYSAIARRMGVTASTVEKHISEAMLRITRAIRSPENDDG